MKNNFYVFDIEHHFSTPTLVKYSAALGNSLGLSAEEDEALAEMEKVVLDLDEGRIANLNAAGVDYAHISLTTPGAEFFEGDVAKEVATNANDILAAEIKRHPDRFGGWISLAPDDPEWSVKEIDRAAKMGLFGWSCLSNMRGKYVDDPKYWPIFEKLEAMGMPIYLHPNFSVIKEIAEFGYALNGPSLGFMVDTHICLMRMICRGVFDKFPKLKVILGHDGEAFPFLMNRVDTAWRQGFHTVPEGMGGYSHEPSYYFKNNIYATTSGNFLPEALRCSLDAFAKGHVMMATDYPYEDFPGSVSLVADSPILSDEEKKATLAENAMALGFGPKL